MWTLLNSNRKKFYRICPWKERKKHFSTCFPFLKTKKFVYCWLRLHCFRKKPGNPRSTGRIGTIDLLDQLVQVSCFFIETVFFFFYKTTYLKEEVNCTVFSPSVRVPWRNQHYLFVFVFVLSLNLTNKNNRDDSKHIERERKHALKGHCINYIIVHGFNISRGPKARVF